MNFPSISPIAPSPFLAPSVDPENSQPNEEVNSGTEEFTVAFFEGELKKDEMDLLLIRDLLMGKEYFLSYETGCAWKEFTIEDINLIKDEIQEKVVRILNELAPIFKTEQASIEARGKINYVLGKMVRDDTRSTLSLDAQYKTNESAHRYFVEAARCGCLLALQALKAMYLDGVCLWEVNTPKYGEFTPSYLAVEILEAASLCHHEFPDIPNEVTNAFLKTVSKDERATLLLAQLHEVCSNSEIADNYLGDAAFLEKNLNALFYYCLKNLEQEYRDSLEQIEQDDDCEEVAKVIKIKKSEHEKEMEEILLMEVAEQGSEQAKNYLEKMYLDGRGKCALTYFSKGDEKDEAAATYGLAMLFAKGLGGVPQNLEKAKTLFEKAAKAGSPDALFWLAEFSLNENETIQHCAPTSEAGKYLIQAAEKGHAMAAYIVGMHYLSSDEQSTLTWTKSSNKAEKLLTIAHNKGIAAATCQLGFIYEQGLTGELDLIKAVKLFKQAALANDPDALCKFGELHLNGLVISDDQMVLQNFILAKDCFRKAVEQNHPRAAYFLTKFYAPGPKDKTENPFLKNNAKVVDLSMKFYLHEEKISSSKAESTWYLPHQVVSNLPSHSGWWGINRYGAQEEIVISMILNNQVKLLELMKIAADGGIADAQYRLGKFHQADMKTELNPSIVNMPDEERLLLIEGCFAKAATQGHELAIKELNG
jgi:TPR repeat protein